MTHHLSQKTFKMELEFAVTMDELGEEHLSDNVPGCTLPFLKRLQQALANNEPALLRQMLAALMTKLQEYADYLAGQSSIHSLQQVLAALEPDERQFFEESGDQFAALTRPIRLASISTRLVDSTILEETPGKDADRKFQPVWNDLLPTSETGRQLARFTLPESRPASFTAPVPGHYLMVRYLNQQIDGFHYEARCTCDTVLEGVGPDETSALESLWSQYRLHTQFNRLAKIKTGLKKLLSKN